MSYSMPINERFNAPSLRKLALTVEEAGPGQFRWRILEGHGMALDAPEFAPISSADLNLLPTTMHWQRAMVHCNA